MFILFLVFIFIINVSSRYNCEIFINFKRSNFNIFVTVLDLKQRLQRAGAQ